MNNGRSVLYILTQFLSSLYRYLRWIVCAQILHREVIGSQLVPQGSVWVTNTATGKCLGHKYCHRECLGHKYCHSEMFGMANIAAWECLGHKYCHREVFGVLAVPPVYLHTEEEALPLLR